MPIVYWFLLEYMKFHFFFHFHRNSNGCLISMAVIHKLNDAACSTFDRSQLTDGYWRKQCCFLNLKSGNLKSKRLIDPPSNYAWHNSNVHSFEIFKNYYDFDFTLSFWEHGVGKTENLHLGFADVLIFCCDVFLKERDQKSIIYWNNVHMFLPFCNNLKL